MTRGATVVNGAVGWLGTGLVLLGLLVGIALPTVFHLPIWASVTLGAVLILGVIAEGSYRLWDETDKKVQGLPLSPAVPTSLSGGNFIVLTVNTGGQGGSAEEIVQGIMRAIPQVIAQGGGSGAMVGGSAELALQPSADQDGERES